jgi:hypothetical protein
VCFIQIFHEISQKLNFAQFSEPQAQMSQKSLSFSVMPEMAQKWHQMVVKDRGSRMIPLEAGLKGPELMKTPSEEATRVKLQISSLFRPHVGFLAVTRSKMVQFRCGFQFQV